MDWPTTNGLQGCHERLFRPRLSQGVSDDGSQDAAGQITTARMRGKHWKIGATDFADGTDEAEEAGWFADGWRCGKVDEA
jgi:hypothetical protein